MIVGWVVSSVYYRICVSKLENYGRIVYKWGGGFGLIIRIIKEF